MDFDGVPAKLLAALHAEFSPPPMSGSEKNYSLVPEFIVYLLLLHRT